MTAIHHMFPCAVVSSTNPAVAVGTDQMRNQLGETRMLFGGTKGYRITDRQGLGRESSTDNDWTKLLHQLLRSYLALHEMLEELMPAELPSELYQRVLYLGWETLLVLDTCWPDHYRSTPTPAVGH